MKLPEFPKKSHGEGAPLRRRTCRDCIGDLATVAPLKTRGRILLDNKVVLDHVEPCKRNKNQKERPERLTANLPAMTVRGSNQLEHYEHDRPLTLRELMRLQSFPDWYDFSGSHTEVRRQVGNAVPVCLATAVAKEIRRCYSSLLHDDLEPESSNNDIDRRATL